MNGNKRQNATVIVIQLVLYCIELVIDILMCINNYRIQLIKSIS